MSDHKSKSKDVLKYAGRSAELMLALVELKRRSRDGEKYRISDELAEKVDQALPRVEGQLKRLLSALIDGGDEK